MPRVLSVSLAVPAAFRLRGRDVPTGIFKEPVSRRVRVGFLSLEGDVQADKRYHGGLEKAVYLYPGEHYPHWRAILGGEIGPGFFGENLTTEGLLEDTVRAGDVLRVGGATLEVTTPRTPCFKLGLKVGSPKFVGEFLESGRLGFYLRVLEEGDVGAGDPIETLRSNGRAPSLADAIASRSRR